MKLNTTYTTPWSADSIKILQDATTPWGIKASLTNTTNYGAIFTRDAVMSGIVGLLLKDQVIIEGFKSTLKNLTSLQGDQGQIASNFKVKNNKISEVSFGTLSPKLDSCTWYLIGIGLLVKERYVDHDVYLEPVKKVIGLLDAWEYNGKHLIYVPKGGNWADEYVYDGYILYDQVLRAWSLSLLGEVYQNQTWLDKATAIKATIEKEYFNEETGHFDSSFYPGGKLYTFDLAAHALLGIVFEKSEYNDKAFEFIAQEFLNQNTLPPAFYPIISESDKDWSVLLKYHLFDFKNKPYHYHNGGIWYIWLGWLAVALSLRKQENELKNLTDKAFQTLQEIPSFDYDEYLSSDKLEPNGTKQLCYTASGITLLALSLNNFDFSLLRIQPQHD